MSLEKSGFILESSFLTSSQKTKFSGMVFTDDAIIISQDGYDLFCKDDQLDFTKLNEGRFCVIQHQGDKIFAKTDGMGQELLYYYYEEDCWAISNSFLALVKHLHDHNVKLSQDTDVLRYFFIRHSSTQQLLSNDTPIREIKILPADKYIRITKNVKPNRFDVVKSGDLSNQGHIDETEYSELLVKFITRSASVSRALLRHYGDRARVDISGGLDSRLVLALIASSDYDLSKINFLSNPSAAADYAVAFNLAKELKFSIKNDSINLSRTNPAVSYELWKLGNVGTYLPVYAPIGDSPQHAVHFHGACGECFREFYPMSGAESASYFLARNPTNGIGAAYQKKLAASFSDMEVDIESPNSMMVHYRHFRSRLHFGRSAFRNLNSILITPLASIDLIKATRHLSETQINRSQLGLDILLATYPKLATMDFDTSDKSFDINLFDSSPFKRGAPNIDRQIYEMKVYASSPAITVDETKGSFRNNLLMDLSTMSQVITDFEVFSEDYIRTASENILSGKRFTMDAITASHIISAGEVALATIR